MTRFRNVGDLRTSPADTLVNVGREHYTKKRGFNWSDVAIYDSLISLKVSLLLVQQIGRFPGMLANSACGELKSHSLRTFKASRDVLCVVSATLLPVLAPRTL